MKAFKHYKETIDDYPELKDMLEEAINDAEELFPDDSFPYDTKGPITSIECLSRDGFIANNYNKGGFEASSFNDARSIEGSGVHPASERACKAIAEFVESNHEDALKDLGFTAEQELTEEQQEELYEKQDEYGSGDTLMYQVRIMFHGLERGVYSVTVQVAINWEAPYHRSKSDFEDYTEVEVAFRKLSNGKAKISKAIKNGVNRLF